MTENIAPYNVARITVRDYVCAKCHGPLIYGHVKESNTRECEIRCADQECKGEGFVSKSFIAARESEDSSNYIEAYINLGKALGISSGKSADELLKELGY